MIIAFLLQVSLRVGVVRYNMPMQKIRHQIAEKVHVALQAAYPTEGITPDIVEESIDFPEQQFGDVASSIALRVASIHKTNPREAADAIKHELAIDDVVHEVTIAGPGYLNFRLQPTYLSSVLAQYTTKTAPLSDFGAGKRAVMDYSHPNIGKPMGVHHLLSTIIGDAIKRTMRQAGYEVIADNFIGDLGTQFGKLIWAVKQWGDTEAIEANPIDELQKLYVKFHIEADSDVALDDAGRAEYLKLEQGDEENRQLWRKIVEWSKAEIQPIYDALGVEFDYMHGESFYEEKMTSILKAGKDAGVLEESEGALVCFSDNEDQPPAILRKSDGATLYITRDLARIDYWEKTWQPDVMLVVVDAAQQFAQKQLYEVARKLKLTDAELVQVNFGRMRFADGSMSTRKGNILLLKDLITEARTRALQIVKDNSRAITSDEQQDAAEKIAISSIKYNILSQNRLSDIVFDWDTILKFDGNSVPHLAYTAARIQSLLTKSGEDLTGVNTQQYSWNNQVERELVILLDNYDRELKRAILEYKPSTITTCIFSLAQLYNNLYNNFPILTADEADKQARLQLSKAVGLTLNHAFACLGLEVPSKM